jgi:signal transduction histidine kinase
MAELRVNGGWRGELDLLVSGGDPAPVDVSIARVDLDGNEVYVAVMRDVRERREYERTQEEFLASVAHDLKNPLAAVRGQAQLLRRRMLRGEMPDPERLLAGLTAIDAGAGRMAGMIDELVDVARLRAGQPIELRRQPVDLAALAQRHVEEMQRLDDRHQFILEAGDAPVFGMWDSARIERVVANLVGNAIKFSPRGGPVTIRVGRGEAFGGPCAVLSVSDQGVGIPASDLPYVFERFHRGRNVGSIRGSGIGLAGARSIVEGHGGTIAVESAEGTGSTFTVRLPLDAP